jgi:mannitol/fructose-specific phosphotransferase system IIA component (Ntr-type)
MPVESTIPVALGSSLADFTRPSLVLPHLRGRDAAAIIHELCVSLHRDNCIPELLPFYQAALNQEMLTNSAQPSGIAFPHGRLGGVKRLAFALGRVAEPVTWVAKSSSPVRLIFLVAVPATDAATYLQLLASLARLGQSPELIGRLHQAEGQDEILTILNQVRFRHP